MADRDWQAVEADFAENIKRWRERKGLSQDALAQQMADLGFPFHQATVYKIEKGERPVRLVEAMALSALLDQYLFGLTEEPVDDETYTAQEAKAALSKAKVTLAVAEADLAAKERDVEQERLVLRGKERERSNARVNLTAARDQVEGLRNLVDATRSGGSATIAGGRLVQHPETS